MSTAATVTNDAPADGLQQRTAKADEQINDCKSSQAFATDTNNNANSNTRIGRELFLVFP